MTARAKRFKRALPRVARLLLVRGVLLVTQRVANGDDSPQELYSMPTSFELTASVSDGVAAGKALNRSRAVAAC